MKVVILFGTESGNSEMVANDVAESIRSHHDIDVQVVDMAEGDVSVIDRDAFHLVVCSTYGDGELPSGAYPFYHALEEQKPDLGGVRYAVFGLGDSDYVYSYSQGSEFLDRTLTGHGATRVGEFGRHDAAGPNDASDLAIEWATSTLTLHLATTE